MDAEIDDEFDLSPLAEKAMTLLDDVEIALNEAGKAQVIPLLWTDTPATDFSSGVVQWIQSSPQQISWSLKTDT
jgi:hypothetical protein